MTILQVLRIVVYTGLFAVGMTAGARGFLAAFGL